MNTFTIHAENVNVEEIMKEIHRRVLEKKEQGIYSDADIQKITELKQELSPQKNERYSELNLHLRKLHLNWDMAASASIIRSHRKVLGPVLVTVKKLGSTVLRFFASAFFTRQTEFNAANVRFNSVVLEELTRLSEENKELRRSQQDLLQRLETLQVQQGDE
ncbi:MAG: hypothetical protein GY801_14895 [bacterium]|nr:hypothetical protein [bacterium]